MFISYRDQLGYITIAVNEYGITFDQEKSLAIFEDENGREYRITIKDILQIANS